MVKCMLLSSMTQPTVSNRHAFRSNADGHVMILNMHFGATVCHCECLMPAHTAPSDSYACCCLCCDCCAARFLYCSVCQPAVGSQHARHVLSNVPHREARSLKAFGEGLLLCGRLLVTRSWRSRVTRCIPYRSKPSSKALWDCPSLCCQLQSMQMCLQVQLGAGSKWTAELVRILPLDHMHLCGRHTVLLSRP